MKKFENVKIVLGCIMIFCCMLTATFVFAQGENNNIPKSYYVEKEEDDSSVEKNLELSTTLSKERVTNSNTYDNKLEIINGNVILIDTLTGKKTSVYSKGNAKSLAEVDYYYYNTSYILIITEEGEIYSNIYASSEGKYKFRKVKTNTKIESLKVVETEKKYFEYPSVTLYGLNENSDWELIRM